MNINLKLILVVLITIAFTACSGIPVSQDFEQGFDYSGFKTFAWHPNDNNEWGLTNNELVDRRIRSAIVNTLTANHFTLKDSNEPDFLISYNLVVEQRVSSSSLSGGVSMGRSSRGRTGSISMSTGSQIRTYDRGTLIIDVTDVNSNKLVWRGISSQALPDLSDPQRLTARINETVEAILKQFPPK
jgi:hypothetical protein